MTENDFEQALLGLVPPSFVRGTLATGIVSAVQDHRRGLDLLQSALLGGAALTAATAGEEWIFKKGKKMGKKAKGKGKKKQALDLQQLQALLGQRPAGGLAALGAGQQFLLGAALGVAATYVLGDEQLRAKLIRTGLGLYESLAGGLAEMKEQVADIQAERSARS